ncbi:hypothetical protein D3C85_1441400 [compost metagenome]
MNFRVKFCALAQIADKLILQQHSRIGDAGHACAFASPLAAGVTRRPIEHAFHLSAEVIDVEAVVVGHDVTRAAGSFGTGTARRPQMQTGPSSAS